MRTDDYQIQEIFEATPSEAPLEYLSALAFVRRSSEAAQLAREDNATLKRIAEASVKAGYFEDALRVALVAKEFAHRDDILSSIVKDLMDSSQPDEARRMAEQITNPLERSSHIVWVLAQTDRPVEASHFLSAAVRDTADPSKQYDALRSVVEKLHALNVALNVDAKPDHVVYNADRFQQIKVATDKVDKVFQQITDPLLQSQLRALLTPKPPKPFSVQLDEISRGISRGSLSRREYAREGFVRAEWGVRHPCIFGHPILGLLDDSERVSVAEARTLLEQAEQEAQETANSKSLFRARGTLNSKERAWTFGRISDRWVELGETEKATVALLKAQRAVQEIKSPAVRTPILIVIADRLAKLGKTDASRQALSIARDSLRESFALYYGEYIIDEGVMDLCIGYVRNPRPKQEDELKQEAQELQKELELRRSGQHIQSHLLQAADDWEQQHRSRFMAGLAKVWARLHDYRTARLSAANCSSKDRLFAYAAILTAYAKNLNPILQKNLESDRNLNDALLGPYF